VKFRHLFAWKYSPNCSSLNDPAYCYVYLVILVQPITRYPKLHLTSLLFRPPKVRTERLKTEKLAKMWSGTSSSNPASPTTPQSPSASRPTYRLKNQGRRIAQIVKLKPEFVDKYKECHAKVWPEVLKQIKDSNIEDCECFSNVAFGYFLHSVVILLGRFWDECLRR
jgi:hypothetical protein